MVADKRGCPKTTSRVSLCPPGPRNRVACPRHRGHIEPGRRHHVFVGVPPEGVSRAIEGGSVGGPSRWQPGVRAHALSGRPGARRDRGRPFGSRRPVFRPSRSRSTLRSRASSRSRILAWDDRSSASPRSRSSLRSTARQPVGRGRTGRRLLGAWGRLDRLLPTVGLEFQPHEQPGLVAAPGVGDRRAEPGRSRLRIDRLVDVIDLAHDLAVGERDDDLHRLTDLDLGGVALADPPSTQRWSSRAMVSSVVPDDVAVVPLDDVALDQHAVGTARSVILAFSRLPRPWRPRSPCRSGRRPGACPWPASSSAGSAPRRSRPR